jgi:putative YhbY family RNA-binding protein
MTIELNSGERRALRARAHAVSASVMIGAGGLTAQVLKEINASLKAHDIVKVRALADRDLRAQWLTDICSALDATPVQHIGKMLVVYRPLPPEEPRPSARPRRRAPRRTKRSFQND